MKDLDHWSRRKQAPILNLFPLKRIFFVYHVNIFQMFILGLNIILFQLQLKLTLLKQFGFEYKTTIVFKAQQCRQKFVHFIFMSLWR